MVVLQSSGTSQAESETLKEPEASIIRMDLAGGVFDARHGDNTDVLLALLTQNKELKP